MGKATKLSGGFAIAISLLSLLLAIVGLVGILRRTPLLVYLYACGVSFTIGFWIGAIFSLAIWADDYIISAGLTWKWTLTIALMVAVGFLFYFHLCIKSFYLELCKEKEEEQEQA